MRIGGLALKAVPVLGTALMVGELAYHGIGMAKSMFKGEDQKAHKVDHAANQRAGHCVEQDKPAKEM